MQMKQDWRYVGYISHSLIPFWGFLFLWWYTSFQPSGLFLLFRFLRKARLQQLEMKMERIKKTNARVQPERQQKKERDV